MNITQTKFFNGNANIKYEKIQQKRLLIFFKDII